MIPLVAAAHGSRDPRAAATVHELLNVVRSRADRRGFAGLDVRAAFLEHCAPSLPQVLSALGSPSAVVPLLLTPAYHSKADIPAQLAAAAAADVSLAGTLGPDRLLLTALERRLAEAGVALDDASRARTSVVLAAAGSADPAANATIARLAAAWQRDRRWCAVVPGYASAGGPAPAEAIAAVRGGSRDADGAVVVATYLLAPGYFADKIRAAALAAGADAVSGVLGAAPEVADVVLRRYEGILGLGLAPSRAERFVARAQLYRTDRGDCPVNKSLHPGKSTGTDGFGGMCISGQGPRTPSVRHGTGGAPTSPCSPRSLRPSSCACSTTRARR
jgi:sirohydrochlorin ferrochelatase